MRQSCLLEKDAPWPSASPAESRNQGVGHARQCWRSTETMGMHDTAEALVGCQNAYRLHSQDPWDLDLLGPLNVCCVMSVGNTRLEGKELLLGATAWSATAMDALDYLSALSAWPSKL